ncbi:DNA replication and repair protein RecF [Thermotomaculum hydrothermale]|uniref:DNA replication and repair protein RecF n=1 Tax=Thermotomaculum hydrothermale TaxID=981385 RepID=A0A7R6T081_9BACT|nr:AAA family ATPase [Thermotomaculum hydrothermale]BBB33495.1 DNA replication and repair protein RecF [Thermotomaculum hydrothermale]
MIENFSCINLRCFEEKKLNLDSNFTLIEGENGSGKTTVLEGISLCLRGKSFLTGRINNLVKEGKEFLKVKTEIEGNSIVVTYSKLENKKEILFNGKKEKLSKIYLSYPLFVFNGRLLNFVRTDLITLYKFFNIILSLYDKGYLKAYNEYLKALKQKRRLLTLNVKNDSILPWNTILLERSKIIREKRKKFVKKINNLLREDNFILYKENSLNENNSGVLDREFKEKKILTGCHRDRFYILKENRDMRFFYSSGQQKNIFFDVLTAVGKAFAEKSGKKPVLLLDDFDSEFDSKNLQYCLNNVLENFQIILTTTDKDRYSDFNYNLISL